MKNRVMKFTGIRNLSGMSLPVFCLISLLPVTIHARSLPPEQTVLDFYHRYMIACAAPIKNKNDGLFCGMDTRKYVTKKLRSEITSTYKAQPVGEASADMGADYFTHTQDFDVRWASVMAVKLTREERNLSVVRLQVNLPETAGAPYALCVRLQRAQGDWKIFQVDPDTANPLPDCR